jgi:hypothetical protein
MAAGMGVTEFNGTGAAAAEVRRLWEWIDAKLEGRRSHHDAIALALWHDGKRGEAIEAAQDGPQRRCDAFFFAGASIARARDFLRPAGSQDDPADRLPASGRSRPTARAGLRREGQNALDLDGGTGPRLPRAGSETIIRACEEAMTPLCKDHGAMA